MRRQGTFGRPPRAGGGAAVLLAGLEAPAGLAGDQVRQHHQEDQREHHLTRRGKELEVATGAENAGDEVVDDVHQPQEHLERRVGNGQLPRPAAQCQQPEGAHEADRVQRQDGDGKGVERQAAQRQGDQVGAVARDREDRHQPQEERRADQLLGRDRRPFRRRLVAVGH